MAKLSAINANLLVVLAAVLEEQSVQRAAARLGLSQPAVSNQLAKLRSILGDPLLVRVGVRMQLTPKGEALLPSLRAGVAAFQAVLDDPGAFVPSECREHFRVAMVDLAEAALLPELLARLSSDAPHAALQVLSAGVFEVSAGLAEGTVDGLLSIVSSSALGDGFYETRLFETAFSIIARRGHPRIPDHGVLSVEEYAALDHVVVTPRLDGRGNIDDRLAGLGLDRRIRLRVPRGVLVPPLIASSDLVAAVDTVALLPYRGQLPIREIRVEGLTTPTGWLSLVWHERTHRDVARRYLRQVIREVAASVSERLRGD